MPLIIYRIFLPKTAKYSKSKEFELSLIFNLEASVENSINPF